MCSVLLGLCAYAGQAATVTATGSGNWDSTASDAPWPGGTPPAATDDAVIGSGFTVTVTSPATIRNLNINGTGVCQNSSTLALTGNLSGSGTFSQGTGANLTVAGTSSGLAALDASAIDNTVEYTGNAGGGVKLVNYYNLVLSGNGTLFNNSSLVINSNLTLSGSVHVQQGDTVTIGGDLNIGTGTQYDPSCFPMTVSGGTIVAGTLVDLCGGGGLANSLASVTVLSGGQWNLTDVTQWSVGGSLTNEGNIFGSSGRITLAGSGTIAGTGVFVPNLTVSGTYSVGTLVVISNNPVLSGTLTMDIGQSHMLIRNGGALTYGGTLNVINSGASPANGNSFQLFSASSYNGTFASTAFPPLGSGLFWIDNLLTSGSIVVTDNTAGPPILTAVASGGNLTLSWDTSTFLGYFLQGQTNSTGIGVSWGDVAGGNSSPVLLAIDPANAAVFFRLFKP